MLELNTVINSFLKVSVTVSSFLSHRPFCPKPVERVDERQKSFWTGWDEKVTETFQK